MRTIIAGGRTITDYSLVLKAIKESSLNITTVISGGASGVDLLGERYAKEKHLALEVYKAEWKKYGASAGPIRNRKMAENAQQLIAIWDGKSIGTKNMIDIAKDLSLTVYVKMI